LALTIDDWHWRLTIGAADAKPVVMNAKAVALQERTQKFAADVIKFCESLPRTLAAQKVAEQLLDAAGATDSNYRATCRARSSAEFIAKIGVAVEEADESKGWLELLVRSNLVSRDSAQDLIQEADELTRIFVKSRKTAQERQAQRLDLAKQINTARRRRG
jgi:four helix bundle protein